MQESTSSSQIPRTPLYTNEPVRRKPRSTTSKIRDSCHSCAISKVRCPKEKPTCARCMKRGVVCEYFVTKRPGRKRDNHVTEATETCHQISPPNSLLQDESGTGLFSSEPSSMAILNSSSTARELSNVSGTVEFSSYINVLADFMPPMEQSSPPRIPRVSNNFDGNLTPPIDFLKFGLLDSNMTNFAPESYDIEGLLTSSNFETGPSFENPLIGCTLPSKSFFALPVDQQGLLSNHDENSNTGVLDIMSKLFIPETPSSASMSTSPSDAATISNNTTSHSAVHSSAQAIVTQNKYFIESVDGILQCSLCAKTGYLMAILSTIISKILERYTIAARQDTRHSISEEYGSSERNGRKNTTTKEYAEHFGAYPGMHYNDARRSRAQLVLSELHRVQGLMNRLCKNALKEEAAQNNTDFERNSPRLSFSDGQRNGSEITFSAATLREMKSDLRKNLSSLSFGIIKMLRES
ncbi:C6 transcription factor (AflR), putative [Talaromyces stipitatus ATCC 10500]|uniref:C6 transcription factor (AflR), putative n=1 Tax=Talaromyces stipitatus (strain ATCC 10500 / CBS 375.48 / QM 6759 / NRRL 1006) TaxID=441959 RepID=B8MBB2_TALSN|nr:C6 transcription factor (AflR), putative [Talaromyces stipitatus ATCC 10500]EED18901.1 C6 transcription factor (AflR), putative [Talaromyces stipitatus ATCC 10500]